MSGFERFSSHDFLLERGKATYRYLGQEWRKDIFSFVIRSLLFGGFLGILWVITHLHPQGDLSLYLIPFILFAMPIAMIAPKEQTWQRILNYSFVASYWVMIIWSSFWYFKYDYLFKWLFLSSLLTLVLSWISNIKFQKKATGPQQSLLLFLWLFGIVICMGFLGILAYYLSTQTMPELDTTHLLAGGCFVFFTAMMLIRIFWLNSIKNRRATRAEHTPPQDFVLFFEWLIPSSYSFILVLISVLISEAMLFSTINYSSIIKEEERIREEIEKQETSKAIYNNRNYQVKKKPRFLAQDLIFAHDQYDEHTDLNQIIPKNHVHELKLYLPKLAHPLTYEKDKKLEISPIQRLELFEKWLYFSFKPYVFPKNAEGLELKTPDWFRFLGRTLLGLIFAILLTQQFNIWFRLGSLYLTLVGAKKRKILRGETEDLNRQETEMLLLLQSTFNHLSSFWRLIFFRAVINIKLHLRWKLVFDPGMVFFDVVDRIQLWLMSRWYMALLSVTLLMSVIMLPFYYLEPDTLTQITILNAFQNAIQPILICTIFILILRFAFKLLPPKSYQFWIWWVLLSHMIFALLVFFLDISINTGNQDLFWAKVLWYLQLCSVGVFPALYLFGGERYRHVTIFGMRSAVDSNDCDIQANLSILRALFSTDHRQWLLQKIISYVHPMRSGSIQFKLILPSILQGIIDLIKYLLTKLSALFKALSNDYGKSSIIWIGFVGWICAIAMLWHMFRYHKFLTPLIISIYLLNFFCLALPTFLTTAFLSIKKLGKGNDWHRPHQPLSLLIWLFMISCLSTYIWWYYFHHQSNALVTQEIFEEMFIYTRFTYVFIIPILPIWVLYQQYQEHKNVAQPKAQEGINLLDRFNEWLAQKEQSFLNSIYQKTMKNKALDSRIRIELIEAAYILLNSTYVAVASGKWDEEEEHAIRRVYLQWVGAYQKDEEMGQLGHELTDLQEQLVDTLASLLHDLITHRLELEEQENIVIVLIDTLTRIVLLPNPSKLLKADHELRLRFEHCYSALGNMIAWMLKDLKNDLVRSQRFKLLKLLSALKEASFEALSEELIKQDPSETLKLELITASQLQNNSLALVAAMMNAEKEEPEVKKRARIAYLSKKLPTPLAKSLYRLCMSMDELVFVEKNALAQKNQSQGLQQMREQKTQQGGSAQYIDDIQNPLFLQQRLRFLQAQEQVKQLTVDCYQQLYHCYLEAFAYLICMIKDIELLENPLAYSSELQCLPWHTAEEQIYSVYQLKRSVLKSEQAIQLRGLVLELFSISEIKLMEKLQQNQKELDKGFQSLIRILSKLAEQQASLPILYYHPTKDIDLKQIESDLNLNIFIFEGLKPRVINIQDFHAQYTDSQRKPLSFGRGIWMKEFDIRPIIDYYPALWCLKQIHILSYSDGLFHPENKEKIKAGLDLLLEIASRFASLLRPFPPEEQRIISEIYHQISDRLYLLKDLSVDELNRIEGQGNIDFEEGLIRLVKYLDGLSERVEKRFEHLLALEMLPADHFIYLEGAENQDLGELRWYEGFEHQKSFIYLHKKLSMI